MGDNEVIVFGAGSHARVLAETLEREGKWRLVGFLDDDRESRSAFADYPFLGGREALPGLRARGIRRAVLGIGANAARHAVATFLTDSGFALPAVTHPFTSVSRTAVIGDGAVILAGAIVDHAARIGRGSLLNLGAKVAHESEVGAFAHVAPNACLGAYGTLEDESLLGMGAVVLPHVRVGKGSVVGAGAVVVRSLGTGTVACGVPARERER